VSDSPVLELVDARVVYPDSWGGRFDAIRGVSIDLRPGEILGLVGESGSGKSTVARAMLGLVPLDEGYIRFQGSVIDWSDRSLRPRVQAIFQNPIGSLNPKRSILDSVVEPLRVWNRGTPSERRQLALDLFDRVGIRPEVAARRPTQVSGGQCQRAAIARAAILEPEVLICDEPVSSLDVSIQAQILELLAELRQERELAILFISHDLSVVSALCDRTAVMYAGRVVESGPALALANEPLHPYSDLLHASAAASAATGSASTIPAGTAVDGRSLPGCSFEPLCPRAGDLCRSEDPSLRPRGVQRWVACHFPLDHAQSAFEGSPALDVESKQERNRA
jgi:oligopeptide/dipeptide ABC transporter ATP-binding protein